jgi:hypothetical protein
MLSILCSNIQWWILIARPNIERFRCTNADFSTCMMAVIGIVYRGWVLWYIASVFSRIITRPVSSISIEIDMLSVALFATRFTACTRTCSYRYSSLTKWVIITNNLYRSSTLRYTSHNTIRIYSSNWYVSSMIRYRFWILIFTLCIIPWLYCFSNWHFYIFYI